ncbi:MAG: hypothetical protein J6I66_11030 [Lachnospiraceae bacterium]|nr:hypothetical protein [Lachnospiraceae bacterium]
MSQGVTLKSYNGAIKLILDPEMNFNELLGLVRDKFYGSRNFLGSASIILDIEGRKLSDIEESLIVDAINASCDVDVACIVGKNENDQEHIRKVGEILNDKINSLDKCIILQSSVMNKQVIDVEDSVLVLGDVNPGSQIRSAGNIIVLGGLYGSAYAGSSGDESTFVCAIEMEPESLFIGDKKYIPDSKPIWSAMLKPAPKVARVSDGELTIGPLNRVVMEKIYESKKLSHS